MRTRLTVLAACAILAGCERHEDNAAVATQDATSVAAESAAGAALAAADAAAASGETPIKTAETPMKERVNTATTEDIVAAPGLSTAVATK